MSYPDSVRYLYSLGNELKAGAKFGLERMQVLLRALGHPEEGARFVHVAGTNGKGSTSAAIAAVLQQAGYRTGLYTSPHLQSPVERIQMDGEPVSESVFAEAFEQVHSVAERLVLQGGIDAHPSYFETVTAMALLIFQQQCEISVIEVGLGGRLDATNIIMPELTVLTPISFDHEAYLGNSLEAIAGEKAGILKAGIPVVVARQELNAWGVIERTADKRGCPIVRCEDADVSQLDVDRYGCRFSLEGSGYEFPLAGRHQIQNAVTAILACLQLGIEPGVIREGLRMTSWPGRLEYVARAPDFILDGAHNPAGAAALAAYIREFWAGKPVWIVYGAMRDKAIEEVTNALFPLADRLILTAPEVPRALRPEAIAEMTEHPDLHIAPTIRAAIAKARSAPADAAVFFTGSLFLVGEARGYFQPLRKIGHS